MASSGMFRRVALVRTDVSEELSASFIRVTGIGELGTTLAVTRNRRTQHAKRRFLQEPHCVTSQNTPFFYLILLSHLLLGLLSDNFVRVYVFLCSPLCCRSRPLHPPCCGSDNPSWHVAVAVSTTWTSRLNTPECSWACPTAWPRCQVFSVLSSQASLCRTRCGHLLMLRLSG
jgi:hypothetical protein